MIQTLKATITISVIAAVFGQRSMNGLFVLKKPDKMNVESAIWTKARYQGAINRCLHNCNKASYDYNKTQAFEIRMKASQWNDLQTTRHVHRDGKTKERRNTSYA